MVIAALSTLAAAAIGFAALDVEAAAKRPSCAATVVRYQAAKHPSLHDTPWILARPATRGVLGFVVSYPGMLRDGRVNRADGLVAWTEGTRIVWSGRSLPTTLVGRRLDGAGAFRTPLVRSADRVVSDLRFPSPGCWRLRLGDATAVVRVVSKPSEVGCSATRLVAGKAFARPGSSGIYGGWGPWRTRNGGALLYTHGHGAGLNMKVPWWLGRGRGPSLGLTGMRLDAAGSFTQEFPMAVSPTGVYPSIVDVPAAGCWLLRLRTGRLAGVLVIQAVDDRG